MQHRKHSEWNAAVTELPTAELMPRWTTEKDDERNAEETCPNRQNKRKKQYFLLILRLVKRFCCIL